MDCLQVEYDENGCFSERPYLFGEDSKYESYQQVNCVTYNNTFPS